MRAPTVLGPRSAGGQLGVESSGDAIRLLLATADPIPTGEHQLPGVLDIGEAGVLLGVEIDFSRAPSLRFPQVGGAPLPHDQEVDTSYIELAEAPQAGQVRSVPVTVRVLTADGSTVVAVEVPRRGHGYEISYPSGNR